jgi:hypothetical protein
MDDGLQRARPLLPNGSGAQLRAPAPVCVTS